MGDQVALLIGLAVIGIGAWLTLRNGKGAAPMTAQRGAVPMTAQRTSLGPSSSGPVFPVREPIATDEGTFEAVIGSILSRPQEDPALREQVSVLEEQLSAGRSELAAIKRQQETARVQAVERKFDFLGVLGSP